MRVHSFDHVALWVSDRDRLGAYLREVCAMHEIDRTDGFTLVGGDARAGKLTLFAAEGEREPGPLTRIVLSVPDLERSLAAVQLDPPVCDADGPIDLTAPGGVPLALVEAPGVPDLDHVELTVADPAGAADALGALGFAGGPERLSVGERYLTLSRGRSPEVERPMLHHLALRVESVDDACARATEQGVEIERMVEAANTRAAFVRGPAGIVLEYVEHLPGFALV
ncbi:MAG: VOC family protein [Gaiella sp.]